MEVKYCTKLHKSKSKKKKNNIKAYDFQVKRSNWIYSCERNNTKASHTQCENISKRTKKKKINIDVDNVMY